VGRPQAADEKRRDRSVVELFQHGSYNLSFGYAHSLALSVCTSVDKSALLVVQRRYQIFFTKAG
jgi:hypothetical protein